MKKCNIVLGIMGGIAAATKPIDFIIKMKQSAPQNGYGVNIDTILTPTATHFVTPLSLQTFSCNKVHLDMFERVETYKPDHVSLSEHANIMILMPATASTIGKIVGGIADNLLTTTVLATTCPIVIAPAMNVNMWNNKYTQRNIEKLRNDKQFTVINPIEGMLACGYEGVGALAEIDTIFEAVNNLIIENKLYQ